MFFVSVLLLASLGLSCSFRTAENVVFEQTHEISVVRSKWMFSFFTDLKAYQDYMTKIQVRILNADRIMQSVLEKCRRDKQMYYYRLYEGQQREVTSLKSLYRAAHAELRDILVIQQVKPKAKRMKRALIPFLGKVLSFLTGTLTKKDLRKVYAHIDTLSDNQERIVHVLNDTLTILNVTNVEVQRNRQFVKSLATMVGTLDRRLTLFTGHLQKFLGHLNFFLVTYLQIDLILTELRESIEKAMFYMDNIKMELDQLSLGHLAPSVIHPGELKQILTGIQSQIPKHLTLPAPVEDIWYYYKTLTCVTLIKDRKFITLVSLPLLQLNSLFEVYQVHNIPLPYANTRMTATYELEASSLAVNAKRTDYILLTAAEVARCSNPSTKFCTLRSPLYKLGESKLCVLSLFRRDKSAISENCQTKVRVDSILPQAAYIPDGNWIIVAGEKLLFTIMCLRKETYQVETKPPIFHLNLAPACEAFADGMTLPPFYHKESHYGQTEQRNELLTLQNVSTLMMWQPMNIFNDTSMTLMTDMLDDIRKSDDVQDVPIDTLVDRLNKLQRPNQLKLKSLWEKIWEFLEYVLIFLAVLGILILTLWLKYRGKLNLPLCMQAMGICKRHETDTNQKAGHNVENVSVVPSTGSADGQQMEVQREVADGRPPETLELGLGSKVKRRQ